MNFKLDTLSPGLYLVGVPIGTARDITLRALDTLASAQVLVAEDTRSLRKLMDIHGVPLSGRKIQSLHDHSAAHKVEQIAQLALSHSVAYASEAGMPLIADPGFELVRAARAAGAYVTAAPGATAMTTALALGGLATDAFLFAGFLPAGQSARRSALEAHRDVAATLVYYESPKRITRMLADAADILGPDRQVAICRELTKKFEEIRTGALGSLAQDVDIAGMKGEICVLIARGAPNLHKVDISQELRVAMASMSVRDAVDAVAGSHGLNRRVVYKAALDLREGKE